jgi:hypothetical protein
LDYKDERFDYFQGGEFKDILPMIFSFLDKTATALKIRPVKKLLLFQWLTVL